MTHPVYTSWGTCLYSPYSIHTCACHDTQKALSIAGMYPKSMYPQRYLYRYSTRSNSHASQRRCQHAVCYESIPVRSNLDTLPTNVQMNDHWGLYDNCPLSAIPAMA